MNKQELEQLFRAADSRIYDFYRRALYQMQEHPSLFWVVLALAIKGILWW